MARGASLCCRAWASHCSGFSCLRAHALDARASVVAALELMGFSQRAVGIGKLMGCAEALSSVQEQDSSLIGLG